MVVTFDFFWGGGTESTNAKLKSAVTFYNKMSRKLQKQAATHTRTPQQCEMLSAIGIKVLLKRV